MINNFNFTVNVSRVLSTSISLMWSITYNTPMTQNVSKFDISHKTIFQEWIYVVKLASVDNISTSIQISGLLPDSIYNCCVTTHIMINLPIEVINSACTTVRTLAPPSNTNDESVVIVYTWNFPECVLFTFTLYMYYIIHTLQAE